MSLISKFLGQFSGADFCWTLVSFFAVLIIVRMVQVFLYVRHLPPGPWGVPFLGFLPFLQGTPHLQFNDMRKKYGPTFSARLGNQLLVVLSDYKTIRKAFRNEAFSGRPENEISAIIEGYGVVNVDGKLWKEQRKFLHEQLRRFGMKQVGSGKEKLEARIMTEVTPFLCRLEEESGAPIALNNALTLSFSNVICSLLMSVKFCRNDPRFNRFMGLIEEGFQLCTATGASNFIPCLRHLPRLQALNVKIQANREEMSCFFRDIVEEHKKTFDPSNIRDVVDTYLQEIEIAKQEGRDMELFHGKDSDRQIYQILGDLYSAGMETTKTTMNWAMLYMLHYPDILKKVQTELDEVVGEDRLPSLEDLSQLPYTEATLLEVFRRACIVPLGTTHSTTTDVTLDGFLIPKNSQVMPLIYAVHMDPTLWPEPERFDPNRFLSPEGKVEKPEFFIPFGTGRRMCLGDVLARHQLFLFFTSLLHVFEIAPVKGATLPDLVGKSAVTIIPDEYELCLTTRKPALLHHSSISKGTFDPYPPSPVVSDKRNIG